MHAYLHITYINIALAVVNPTQYDMEDKENCGEWYLNDTSKDLPKLKRK